MSTVRRQKGDSASGGGRDVLTQNPWKAEARSGASSPALGKMQEKGLGETGVRKQAEQGLTGSRQGRVWSLGVGWQRMEMLTRVWKILGNWSITKELA